MAVFHVVNGGLTMTPKRRSTNLRQSISGIFFDNGKTPEDFFYGCVRCKYAIFFLFASCRARTQNVIPLKRDRVCRRRHAKTKETRRYGADENRSVLEKNRTEPVKKSWRRKKVLIF